MSLSKHEILQGNRARRSVPIEALGGEVKIRPLTDGEFHAIQMVFVEAVRTQFNFDDGDFSKGQLTENDIASKFNAQFNIREFAEADHSTDVMASAYGLSVDDEVWTTEEVEQLPPGAVKLIANEVFDLSGARPEQEAMLRSFREDKLSGGSSIFTDGGSSISTDSNGLDTGPEDSPGGSIETTEHNTGPGGAR